MLASGNKPPALKKRALSLKQQQQHNFSFGEFGEQQAADYLGQHGYRVLERNVRRGNKEIDLIAWDEGSQELVFIEVKTRKKGFYGEPSRAVDRDKLRSMQYVAAIYRRTKQLDCDYRFDILTLVDGTIHHYQNVTWSRR